jgi:hypothetical protein
MPDPRAGGEVSPPQPRTAAAALAACHAEHSPLPPKSRPMQCTAAARTSVDGDRSSLRKALGQSTILHGNSAGAPPPPLLCPLVAPAARRASTPGTKSRSASTRASSKLSQHSATHRHNQRCSSQASSSAACLASCGAADDDDDDGGGGSCDGGAAASGGGGASMFGSEGCNKASTWAVMSCICLKHTRSSPPASTAAWPSRCCGSPTRPRQSAASTKHASTRPHGCCLGGGAAGGDEGGTREPSPVTPPPAMLVCCGGSGGGG